MASYTHFKGEILVRRHETNALKVIRGITGALFLLVCLKGRTASTLAIGGVGTERGAQSSAAEASGIYTTNKAGVSTSVSI